MEHPLQWHHMCITVEDMDEAIHLWQDVLGFELTYRGIIPDPDTLADNSHMEDSTEGEEFYQSETATLDSNCGAMMELQRQIHPEQHNLSFREKGYGYTHITEVCMACDDIDYWYNRIVEAGYTPQSEPWISTPSGSRTFVFYDKEGNIIQLWQDSTQAPGVAPYKWERISM